MGDGTSIEWTDASWVMIAGCDHVSEGCGLPRWDGDLPGGCYAAKLTSGRLKHRPEYSGLAENSRFTGEVRLLEHRLKMPLHWRKPRKIFVSDMADLFHQAVPDEFIAKVFAVMALCPQHTFQCLTKRHARLRSLLNSVEFDGLFQEIYVRLAGELGHPDPSAPPLPLPNVWVGVSVESQKWADIRIPALLGTPAAVRWISAEPLLGPVDLSMWLNPWNRAVAHSKTFPEHILGPYEDVCGETQIDCSDCDFTTEHRALDWLVCGGESGPGARPMHPDWARSLRDQCVQAGTAFFFKQWGAWAPRGRLQDDGPLPVDNARTLILNQDGGTRGRAAGSLTNHLGTFSDGSHCEVMENVGKKAAGRLLDGREWSEFPQSVEVCGMADRTPAQELREAAGKLDAMVEAALKDLRSSKYYGHDPANFSLGIDNAVGGAAGELAALFSPDLAGELVRALKAHADEHSAYDCDWVHCPMVALARVINGGAA